MSRIKRIARKIAHLDNFSSDYDDGKYLLNDDVSDDDIEELKDTDETVYIPKEDTEGIEKLKDNKIKYSAY
ncbi:MAG: hypothetical protein IRZ03_13220 [Acidobacterium ailaaui]|nr:hypothetical protein [Pseudacidobacterium ailaaui]